jgi:hypothetical protein
VTAPLGPRFRWALAAAFALAAAHVAASSFLCDDAFISFRYADRLASGDGLVFQRGERVEGYTNFLWIVLLAGGIRLGIRPEVLAAPLGAAISLGFLGAVLFTAARRGRVAALPFAFLLAGSSAWAAWSTGGLETALFAALLGGAAFALSEETGPRTVGWRLALSSACLALAVLTRPEGALVAACLLLVLLRRGSAVVPGASLAAWTAGWAVPLAAHTLWRHAYYGRWLPNTAAVKVRGLELLPDGLAYLGEALLDLGLLPLVATVAAWAWSRRDDPRAREGLLSAAAVALPLAAVVALAGGDFMDRYRFLVPALPPFLWLAGESLAALGRRGRAGAAAAVALVALVVAGNVAGTAHSAKAWHERGVDSIGLLRRYTADWSAVGRHLAGIAAPGDTVAVTAAGCIPYHSGLHTIDQLGLVAADLSAYVPREPPRPGHSLLLRGDALLAIAPQFVLGGPIVTGRPEEARPASWVDASGRERFEREYESIVGVLEEGGTRRYYVFAARKDVAARLRATPLR